MHYLCVRQTTSASLYNNKRSWSPTDAENCFSTLCWKLNLPHKQKMIDTSDPANYSLFDFEEEECFERPTKQTRHKMNELSQSDLDELEKLQIQLNSRMISPSIRALFLLHQKNNPTLIDYRYEPVLEVTTLENEYLLERKEKSNIEIVEDKCDDLNDEEIDEEDITTRRRLNQKRELKLMTQHMMKNKQTFCEYLCEGEEEFIYQNSHIPHACKFYTFKWSPNFCPSRPCGEDFHFRLAQNFLLRSPECGHLGYLGYGAQGSYTLDQVTYVCNPYNLKRFYEKKRELAKRHSFLYDSMKPLVLFHGNPTESNYDNIMKTNFTLSKIGSNTGNTGAYGKGKV